MTITYISGLESLGLFGLIRVAFVWHGSVYKLIWKELVMLGVLHFTLFFVYKFALNDQQKLTFEETCDYSRSSLNLIPLSMILGFFVTSVNDRFFQQFNAIPWPHRFAQLVSTFMRPRRPDVAARVLRLTMMRYFCLAIILCFRSFSPTVRKRFPTLKDLTNCGLISSDEEEVLEKSNLKSGSYYLIVLVWIINSVNIAKKREILMDDFALESMFALLALLSLPFIIEMMQEVNNLRSKLATLTFYDMYGLPLVYVQTVAVAGYGYACMCVIGNIYNTSGSDGYKLYPEMEWLPYMRWLTSFIVIAIYLGWLKVAETTIFPFSDDDEDFDFNMLIDRFIQESFVIVDDLYDVLPEVQKDENYDKKTVKIPYTDEAEKYKKIPFAGSARHLRIPIKLQHFAEENVARYWIKKRKMKRLQSKPIKIDEKKLQQMHEIDEPESFENGLDDSVLYKEWSAQRSTDKEQATVVQTENRFGVSRIEEEEEAQLEEVILEEVQLEKAHLKEERLVKARMEETRREEVRLEEERLEEERLEDARLEEEARLAQARIKQAQLPLPEETQPEETHPNEAQRDETQPDEV